MKGTRDENLLAGLTAKTEAGRKSLPVMRDGEEPPDMLLALLNNVLPSMIDSQQAKILGTAVLKGRPFTLLAVYDVVPTSENLLVEAVPTKEKT